MTARVLFLGGLAVGTAACVMAVQALPTLFDILIVPAAVVASAVAGRKSIEWF